MQLSALRAAGLVASLAAPMALGALAIIVSIGYSAGPSDRDTTIVFPRGTGLAGIAESLEEAGVVEHATEFATWVRVSGNASALQAGEYRFPPEASVAEVARMLVEGRTHKRWLTAIEGQTTARILAEIAAAEGAVGDTPADVPEGTLLPETYRYEWCDTRETIVRRMQRAMEETVNEIWVGRGGGLPLAGPHELVTLASMVESEAGRRDESARVAGVFINRLRIGMRLQSDPTVAYGLDRVVSKEAPLTRADLRVNHPHNTYVHAGLPPTPISNPGRAALEAAAHPSVSGDLFFVADGEGGHRFAETLEAHNSNVARFRALQRR